MTVRIGGTIRRWAWVCVLTIVAAFSVTPYLRGQTLTNADVVKMVQAKLGDALIISEIKHSTCKFDTSPNGLIKLKQAGVSDAVLQAMTEARHAESGSTTASSPGRSNTNIPVPENYGVYAAADGKLLGIDVPASTMTPPTVSVRLREGMPSIPVPGFRPPPPTNEKRIPVLPAGLVFVQFGGGHEIDSGQLLVLPYDSAMNAWDFRATIQLGLPTIQLLARPMTGHADVTVLSPPKPLAPGVYGLKTGYPHHVNFLFAVGQPSQIEHAAPTSALSPSGQPSAQSTGIPARPSGIATACGDYENCLNAGTIAFQSSKLSEAILDFQGAASQRPASGVPWVWLGRTYLRTGQVQDFSQAWDKALGLGGTIVISACHELTFRPCDRGDLSLNTNSVAFHDIERRTVFAVSPSQVIADGVSDNRILARVSFGLQVGRRKYNFDAFPFGVACRAQLFVQCPPEGVKQELAVGNYITATIPKLSSGTFHQPLPSPVSSLPSSDAPASGHQPMAGCSNAPDLVYTIQNGQHTYKVEAFGTPGPYRAHAFLNESGEVVKNNTLLQQLALGAWTKEMIVDRHDPRRTVAQVDAALAASNNLEGWEDATDVLARATVESIKAVATGGTSLNTAAQNLTLGVVERQLTSPKVALAHWAHADLVGSLNDYTQMEQHWPSTGTTVFKLSELEEVKSLYTEGNMLFSVGEGLVGAIAPTTWQDEFSNYISSAVSELKPSLPSSATILTLDNVLKLEELVAATGKSFNAYKQALYLAQRVAAGDQQEISGWAAQAANACGQAVSPPRVDFRNFSYPSVCWRDFPRSGFDKTIHVSNGKWENGTGSNEIYFSVGKPIYADLTGNGKGQAVVGASCGFTSGDTWSTEVFIYQITSRTPTLLGVLTSSNWGEPSWGILWRVANDGIRVDNGRIAVSYYVGGSHAEPAWTATATFQWNGTHFVRTRITRKPFTP